MAEYQKFITTIDSFETLSQDIIKNCEDFTQTAMEIGSKIGDVVGKGAGKAVSYVDDSDIKGSATKVGLSIFSTVAKDLFTAGFGAAGELRKNIKYKNTIKKIREQGLEWKERCFALLPQSVEIYKNRIKDINKDLDVIKNRIENNPLEKEGDIEITADQVRLNIKYLYQSEYRIELAERISYYFDNFENQLDDLESFANCYQESVLVNKIECYKRCYENTYNNLIKNMNDDQLNFLDNAFHIIDSMVPILILDSPEKHANLIKSEVARYLTEATKKKEFIEKLPEKCYNTEGIEKLTTIYGNVFYGIIIPKYKKFRNIFMSVPAILVTSIYSILSITKVFSLKNIIKLNFNEYLFIPFVFLIIEFICLVIVLLKRARTLNHNNMDSLCNKYTGYCFHNELYQLCEDYAEKEKEIDKNELETIEQEPQENLIKDINGNLLTQEEMLEKLRNEYN